MDRPAGGDGYGTQQRRRDRVERQHDAQHGRPPRGLAADEITDAEADCG